MSLLLLCSFEGVGEDGTSEPKIEDLNGGDSGRENSSIHTSHREQTETQKEKERERARERERETATGESGRGLVRSNSDCVVRSYVLPFISGFLKGDHQFTTLPTRGN